MLPIEVYRERKGEEEGAAAERKRYRQTHRDDAAASSKCCILPLCLIHSLHCSVVLYIVLHVAAASERVIDI